MNETGGTEGSEISLRVWQYLSRAYKAKLIPPNPKSLCDSNLAVHANLTLSQAISCQSTDQAIDKNLLGRVDLGSY